MDDQPSIHFLSKSHTGSTKFNLFLKAHEMKQVEELLRQVMMLPKKERKQWVKENGALMHEAYELFIEDSSLTLEEMNFDSESLELSKELVTALRDTSNIVQGILSEKQNLTS